MKKIYLVCVILLVLGAALMLFGFLAGAFTGVYFDLSGIHLGEKSDYVSTDTFDSITAINADMVSADIKVVPAGHFGIEIQNRQNRSIDYKITDGQLSITQERGFSYLPFSWSFRSPVVTIYLPAGAQLDTVLLKTTSGNITANSFNCTQLDVSATSGNLRTGDINAAGSANFKATSGNITLTRFAAEDILVKVTSGNLTFDGLTGQVLTAAATSGNIRGEQVDISREADLKVTSGGVRMNGALTGRINVTSKSGNVRLNLAGNEDDYSKRINTKSGGIYINGRRDKIVYSNPSAVNSIDVNVTSGSVHLNFA